MSDLKGDLASLRIDRSKPNGGRSWPLLLLLPGLLLLGFLYVVRLRAAIGAVEVETTRATLVAAADQRGPAGSPILTASGYVVARRKAVVSAKIQGRLSELRVEEGSRVREGELIARLESADNEAQVLRARAAVARAQADLAEQRRQARVAADLASQSVLAKDALEAAESRVAIAAAALSQAEADVALYLALLQNTVIRAPFSGVVVKKMAEVGESVAPIPPGVNISTASGAIVALADLETLEVEVDVAESNVAKLGASQPAEVTVEAFPDRRYRAALRQVIPTADRTKATVMVKVTILDKDKDLKPEMSAKVTFLEAASAESGSAEPAVPSAPLVTVPKEAVATRDGATFVFEVKDGKVLRRAVELGNERDGRRVVKAGLTGGETLVTRPPDALNDGDSVKVKG
ncbi:MAG: efflux RND transporter periplasmic adaptor subunit [Vicinamibacteria bacterium]